MPKKFFFLSMKKKKITNFDFSYFNIFQKPKVEPKKELPVSTMRKTCSFLASIREEKKSSIYVEGKKKIRRDERHKKIHIRQKTRNLPDFFSNLFICISFYISYFILSSLFFRFNLLSLFGQRFSYPRLSLDRRRRCSN